LESDLHFIHALADASTVALGGDTFDVVPVGGYWGKGRRSGVFGAFLVAVLNPSR
jgi:ATP-dependent DNA ligase